MVAATCWCPFSSCCSRFHGPAVSGQAAANSWMARRGAIWILRRARSITPCIKPITPLRRARMVLRGADVEENSMAGHSQFKNIMHRKGRQDAAKSKLFGKLAREITVAAKLGMPDPAMNPRLRAAVIAARAENMPKDNID